jgi:hypothetical protein
MYSIKRIYELSLPGKPLVIFLSLLEEHSKKEELIYVIEELHTSNRWPIIVVDVIYDINVNRIIEMSKRGGYIILLSGTFQQFTNRIAEFWQHWAGLTYGTMLQSLNPTANLVIPVKIPCMYYDNIRVS